MKLVCVLISFILVSLYTNLSSAKYSHPPQARENLELADDFLDSLPWIMNQRFLDVAEAARATNQNRSTQDYASIDVLNPTYLEKRIVDPDITYGEVLRSFAHGDSSTKVAIDHQFMLNFTAGCLVLGLGYVVYDVSTFEYRRKVRKWYKKQRKRFCNRKNQQGYLKIRDYLDSRNEESNLAIQGTFPVAK